MLAIVLSVCAMLAGILCTLSMIVMFLAGTANAQPAAILQTKWLLTSVVLVQLLALASSIGLLIYGRGWLASAAGLLPVAYAILLVIVLVKMEW